MSKPRTTTSDAPFQYGDNEVVTVPGQPLTERQVQVIEQANAQKRDRAAEELAALDNELENVRNNDGRPELPARDQSDEAQEAQQQLEREAKARAAEAAAPADQEADAEPQAKPRRK